jgi:hypothetical protein
MPPRPKYATRMTADTTTPTRRGAPVSTSKAQAIASSCPASKESVPTQRIAAIATRTARSKRHSRKSPTVRKSCSAASRWNRGATSSPISRQPIAADPDHHQAESPWRYASPAAPTVEPAPMLAASMVAKTIAPESERDATKNWLDRLTCREAQSPTATSPAP